jgi:signal transduction histidine kinase
LRQRVAELEGLREAALRLTASLELQPVLASLLEHAINLSGAADAHIFLYDGERLELGAAYLTTGPEEQPFAEPRPDGLTFTVARTAEMIVIPDVDAHPLFKDWKWGGAIAGFPLSVGARVVGVMNIAFDEPHPFDENELRVLELLAAQAAIAIQNARYYEQVQQHATILEQQVAERTRELADANARLQDLERLKSKFITDISHELRTPLTNIRLGLHLMETGRPEKQIEYLNALQAQSARLVHLVEDILHFSQLELTKVEHAPVNLNGLAEQVLVAHQDQAKAKKLELTLDQDRDLSPVLGQPRQLLRLITELVDNAVTYTRQGRVRVRTRMIPEEDQVCLEVEDTGMGIAEEDLPYIFERFYRGRGVGSSAIPGAGMGLAIAKEIVEQHAGQLGVTSQENVGSTFWVRFPAAG